MNRVIGICLLLASVRVGSGGIIERHGPDQPLVALVVGVNTSVDRSLPPLKYAVADARDVGFALRDLGYKVTELSDEHATRSSLISTVKLLSSAMAGKGTFVFHFSGNGFMDVEGNQYLNTFDSELGDARSSLNVQAVLSILKASGVPNQLLLVDACSEVVQSKRTGVLGGNSLAAYAANIPGLAIVDAASPGQLSYESPELMHGVFSSFVIKGLNGEAADSRGDISSFSLADYVSSSVRQYSHQQGRLQSPFAAGPPTTDILIGLSRKSEHRNLPTTIRGFPIAPEDSPAGAPRTGEFYALLFGVSAYSNLSDLHTPINDINDVAEELKTKFGFQVEVLANPARTTILKALNKYRRDLRPEDSMMIYYAGHGFRDENLGKAYWLPADAEKDDTTNWLASDEVTATLKATAARHIFVVSDSCYSGAMQMRDPHMSVTNGEQQDRNNYLTNVASRKSRHLLASGGNEPVLDGGGDGRHSIFATEFLRALDEMSYDRFTADELARRVVEGVAGKSRQVPELQYVQNSGHDQGMFVFQRQRMIENR